MKKVKEVKAAYTRVVVNSSIGHMYGVESVSWKRDYGRFTSVSYANIVKRNLDVKPKSVMTKKI